MNPWMQIAYDEALSGMQNDEGGPFGAAVVQHGKCIASAHNRVLATNDPTAHAEIEAIRIASGALGRHDLSDCVLYTTCYPCPMCLGAVFWARIPIIYYGSTGDDAATGGFDDARFHQFVNNPEHILDLRPLDLEKTKTLFEQWLNKPDRQTY